MTNERMNYTLSDVEAVRAVAYASDGSVDVLDKAVKG